MFTPPTPANPLRPARPWSPNPGPQRPLEQFEPLDMMNARPNDPLTVRSHGPTFDSVDGRTLSLNDPSYLRPSNTFRVPAPRITAEGLRNENPTDQNYRNALVARGFSQEPGTFSAARFRKEIPLLEAGSGKDRSLETPSFSQRESGNLEADVGGMKPSTRTFKDVYPYTHAGFVNPYREGVLPSVTKQLLDSAASFDYEPHSRLAPPHVNTAPKPAKPLAKPKPEYETKVTSTAYHRERSPLGGTYRKGGVTSSKRVKKAEPKKP